MKLLRTGATTRTAAVITTRAASARSSRRSQGSPLAVDAAEARAAARGVGEVITVGYERRHDPATLRHPAPP